VLGGKLGVERVNSRMWLNTTDVAFAETMIKLDRLPIGEAPVREPHSEIAAHSVLPTSLAVFSIVRITYELSSV